MLQLPRAFLPLIDTRARYKAYYSGRGCAKSTSFAIAAIHKAATEPVRFLCCREIQNSIRESVKSDLDKAITWMGLQSFFVSTQNTVTGANGSHFLFQGMHAHLASIQSLADIDVAWIEEASTASQ